MYLCYLVIISPLERAWTFLQSNKLESSSPKDAWCQVWLKLVVLQEKILKFRQCIFTLSLLSPWPFEMDVALHLHSLYPRIIRANLIESGSREEHFKISSMNLRNFVKVGDFSNFLYQGFFRYLLTQQSLKLKRKLGVSVHLIE